MTEPSAISAERVLILMPAERDSERTLHLLGDANVTCVACSSLAGLCGELQAGAGAVLVTDEILASDTDHRLERTLREQPAWSAVPIVVLARERAGGSAQLATLGDYHRTIIVERPVRTRSLVSTVQSALRARRDQYRIRDALREREMQAEELFAQGEKLREALAELARQADRLRAADRQKDDFLATLAHELRNPLAPISAGLGLLGDASNPEVSRRTLGVMNRQVGHMVRLIDDLLDVSRITRGKLELKRERISLRGAVEAAIEASAPNIQRGQHTLQTDITSEPLVLDADHTRIAQVIGNLLNNSSKYTPNGGTIELSARRVGGEAEIRVRDDGVGIPLERQEDVFQMFGQVNGALDRAQGGLGIGLALVRTLVHMHGGTVTAFSDGPGKGSTFTVRLPLAAGPPQQAQPDSQVHGPEFGQGKRVLLVDDNEDAANLLAIALERAGYATTTVYDGRAALEAAHAQHPHIVILDIGLPGMNGYEVAAALRRDADVATAAIIALTGWGTPEDQRRAMASGFDMHLTKPVTPGALEDALGRAARMRGIH